MPKIGFIKMYVNCTEIIIVNVFSYQKSEIQ